MSPLEPIIVEGRPVLEGILNAVQEIFERGDEPIVVITTEEHRSIQDVATERARQVFEKGYNAAADQGRAAALVSIAVTRAAAAEAYISLEITTVDPRKLLVESGALILAAIDELDAQKIRQEHSGG